MPKGEILNKVLTYVVGQIVGHLDEGKAIEVTIIEQGPEEVLAEVRTGPGDMGRVIGRRGRTARAIRTLAQAAGDEEGVSASVDFAD